MARRKRSKVSDWQGLENLDYREPTHADVDAILAKVRTPFRGEPIRDLLNGKTIERRDALKKYLGYALADYAVTSRGLSRPSQEEEIDAFARIGERAEALLDSLNTLDKSGAFPRVDFQRMPFLLRTHLVAELKRLIAPNSASRVRLVAAMLGPGPEHFQAQELLQNALSAVHMLGDLARAVERQARARTGKSTDSDTGKNVALDGLFGGLAQIYEWIWERSPGRSVGSEFGQRGAEGGPFVRFCVAVLPLAGISLTRASIGDRIKRMRRDMG